MDDQASRGRRAIRTLGWAGTGVLATLVGMAAGHLVAALTDPATSPVLVVGSAVIDQTPTPLKEWAIRQFGSNDKIVLVGSVMLVVLLLSLAAGLLARRRLAYGAVALVVLVAVAAVAALSRPEAGALDLLPSLVAAVAGVAALGLLHHLLRRPPVHRTAGALAHGDHSGPSRRGVVIATGALVAAAAVMGGAGRWISQLRTRPEDVALPAPKDPLPPLPEGLEKRFPQISALQTARGDFYRVDTRLDVPIISVDDWTLTIDGDVDQEVTLTFDDLREMELVERDITMTCVSNSVGGEYVGAARWLGVPLAALLDRAGIGSTGADQILSTDVDGMTISTPLDLATDGRDAMIAIGMNGAPLPREHGYPARMLVPGLYGFVSACKWISRMTLTTYDDASAYWTDRKWATDAPIKISARIDTPKALAQLDQGENVIGGVAWAQHQGGVGKVEVRIDGGPWQPAELGPDVGNDYWRQWFFRWDAPSGTHFVAARATSGDGEVQTAARAQPFPEGSSGIQELQVVVS